MRSPHHQSNTFTPPTAQQVRTHLDRYPPRSPSWLVAWLPIIAMAAALVLGATVASRWAIALSCLTVVGVFTGLTLKMRRMAQIEQRTWQVQELAMLRHWPESLRLAWRLLPSLIAVPNLHGQIVGLMASCLDQLKAYDAAILAYTYLIDRLPATEPASVQLQAQRTIVQLINGQLTDADDALHRLRQHTGIHPVIGANYRLAHLVQQVRTNHWAEAVEQNASDLIDQLRHLGIQSGYGYALMALSCYKLNAHQPEHRKQAQQWWSRATLLLPVPALVNRFDELEQISGLLSANSATPLPIVTQT